MNGGTGALYEPLIERDFDAIAPAARAYLEAHSAEDLWTAVTRFAVLAHTPSQHSKRAVMSCLAAHRLREAMDEQRFVQWLCACARYAAESRQPWSEPPILDPPAVERGQPRDRAELQAAVAAGDRLRAERWLAARLSDCEEDLRAVATGDALLMLDTALALEPLLGSKGRYALLRMAVQELFAPGEHPREPLDVLIDRAIERRGAVDAVRDVFVAASSRERPSPSFPAGRGRGTLELSPYPLSRDYAQTLIAYSIANTLPHRPAELLAAVRDNLEHGESFADWSFA